MNDQRDDDQIADAAERISRDAAENMTLGPRDRMRKAVAPKIEAAVKERKAMLDELTEAEDALPADAERVVLAQIVAHPHVEAYINAANASLKLLGYTEHGKRHARYVAHMAADVLEGLGFSQREVELAEIAGYLHDIGNCINREQHGQSGALLANHLLLSMGMPIDEVVTILGAIGNHEEERGHAVSSVAAAVILADKADVHRARVQNADPTTFDIHDRVNYAATHSRLAVKNGDQRHISLTLTIDTEIASVMDYFEIFLSRMVMCRRAAEFLGARFDLRINEVPLL